jgi:hypothetical protein
LSETERGNKTRKRKNRNESLHMDLLLGFVDNGHCEMIWLVNVTLIQTNEFPEFADNSSFSFKNG